MKRVARKKGFEMRNAHVIRIAFVMTFSLSLNGMGVGAPSPKVELCHVPPGDPSGAHSIVVGGKAAESHLKNHPGDHLGPCRRAE